MGRSANRLVRAVSNATWTDVGTGVITLLLAPVVELGLRLAGLTRTANVLGVRLLLDRPVDGTAPTSRDIPLSAYERRRLRVAWRVLAVGPFDGSCLRRALIGAWILRSRDHAVRIGVRKTPDGIRAHAWLEIDGVSLDPDASGDFALDWKRVGAAS
jgi:Transglutaminase-like superfamily